MVKRICEFSLRLDNKNAEIFRRDYVECGKLLVKLKDLEIMRQKVLHMKQVRLIYQSDLDLIHI